MALSCETSAKTSCNKFWPTQTGNRVALTFDGGGFLSVGAQAGVTSGLLAAHSRKQCGKVAPTMQDSGLFQRFDTLSSISGGSWFMAELIYSETFLDLVERMAASPETSGADFERDWVDAWLSMAEQNPVFVRLLADLAGRAKGPALKQTLQMVGFFLKSGFTWNNYVGTLLRKTANIDFDTPLGSPVQAWSEGKVWLIGTSIAMPTGSNGADNVTIFPPGDDQPRRNFVRYVANTNSKSEATPVYIPAKFSVKLGAGTGSTAPVAYVAAEALPASATLNFRGADGGSACGLFSICCGQDSLKAESPELGRFANFNVGAGSLPLGNVVSCSSSFIGDMAITFSDSEPLTNPFQQLAAAVQGDMSTWSGSAPRSAALSQASASVEEVFGRRHVTQDRFNALASDAVRLTIDGDFSGDNTGIAHAVATGSTDVVSILNLTDTDEPQDFFKLFVRKEEGEPLFYSTKRFEDEDEEVPSDVLQEPSFINVIPIFKETKEDARRQYNRSAKEGTLRIPEGSNTQLISLAVAHIHAHTRDNRFFGVVGGTKVHIQVITVASKLNSGQFVDFRGYAVLVQEIMTTLLSDANQAIVEGTILPAFVGHDSCPRDSDAMAS